MDILHDTSLTRQQADKVRDGIYAFDRLPDEIQPDIKAVPQVPPAYTGSRADTLQNLTAIVGRCSFVTNAVSLELAIKKFTNSRSMSIKTVLSNRKK